MGKSIKLLGAAAVVIGITGCGGGGGGGGSATLSPFVSWDNIQRNSSVVVEGISQSGSYTYNSGTERVTARTLGSSSSGASYTASYDSNGNVTAVTLTPAGGSPISWSRSAGDTFGVLIINNNIDAVVSADGSRYALAANPFDYGWNYQSFGIWVTGAGTGSGTYGAMSIGAATPGSSIPTTGNATFTGFTGGRYINASGEYFFTSSSMSAATNFGTRNITFTTTNTQQTPNLQSNTITNNANLNMSGTLTYSAATNQITGNVSTTGGLNGTVNARFYGPSAQEIGGTFAVDSGGLEGYMGAFGGRR